MGAGVESWISPALAESLLSSAIQWEVLEEMKLDSTEVHGERPRLGAKLGDLISYQGGKKAVLRGWSNTETTKKVVEIPLVKENSNQTEFDAEEPYLSWDLILLSAGGWTGGSLKPE